jgi:ABC-type transport system substrate-binding protein
MYLPESGRIFAPRIAESWEISEDGLSYTFHCART